MPDNTENRRKRPPVARTIAVGILAAAVVGMVGSSPAAAHSELLTVNPEDGSTLEKAPTQVILTFGEEVLPQGSGIVVNGPDDTRYDKPKTLQVEGTKASVQLKTATSDGEFAVTYRIVSVDGHVVSGRTTYTLDGVADASPSPTSTNTTTLDATSAAAQTEPEDGTGTPVVWVLGLGAIGVVLVAAVVAFYTRGRRG